MDNSPTNVNQDILNMIKDILDLPGELKFDSSSISITNPDEEKNKVFIDAFNDLFKKIFKKEIHEPPLQTDLLEKSRTILTIQEPSLQNDLLDNIRRILTLSEKEIELTESMFDESIEEGKETPSNLLDKSRTILTLPEKPIGPSDISLTESMFDDSIAKPVVDEEPEKMETIIQDDLLDKIKTIITFPGEIEKTKMMIQPDLLDKFKDILTLPEKQIGPTGEIPPIDVVKTEIIGPTGMIGPITGPVVGIIETPVIEKIKYGYIGPTGPFNNVVISTNYSPDDFNLNNIIALNVEKDENNDKYIKQTKL